VSGLTEHLVRWDSANGAAFEQNRDALIARIDALDAAIAAQVEPVRDRPFIVFHDAYQYFEQHYGLNAAGSITLDPALSPGARRVQELRDPPASRRCRPASSPSRSSDLHWPKLWSKERPHSWENWTPWAATSNPARMPGSP
jgi:hypothetical protein